MATHKILEADEMLHDWIHCFIESYQNGFYEMQTPMETVFAFIGASTWDIQHVVLNFLTK